MTGEVPDVRNVPDRHIFYRRRRPGGIAACVPRFSTYFKIRGRRQVVCPEDHQTREVEVDPKFALQAACAAARNRGCRPVTIGPNAARVDRNAWPRWRRRPTVSNACLRNGSRASSASSARAPLTPSDWRFGRIGFLNDEVKLIELRQIDLTELGSMDEPKRPLCWTCHQQEKQRQAQPVHIGFVGRS